MDASDTIIYVSQKAQTVPGLVRRHPWEYGHNKSSNINAEAMKYLNTLVSVVDLAQRIFRTLKGICKCIRLFRNLG